MGEYVRIATWQSPYMEDLSVVRPRNTFYIPFLSVDTPAAKYANQKIEAFVKWDREILPIYDPYSVDSHVSIDEDGILSIVCHQGGHGGGDGDYCIVNYDTVNDALVPPEAMIDSLGMTMDDFWDQFGEAAYQKLSEKSRWADTYCLDGFCTDAEGHVYFFLYGYVESDVWQDWPTEFIYSPELNHLTDGDFIGLYFPFEDGL